MPDVSLHRTLTLPLVVLYGLGVTVGAGIYVLIGETVNTAGTYAPVSFLMAAIVVGFTAFTYAELSTRFPVSAGAAVYVANGFQSNRLAQIVGLAVAFSGIISASAVAIGSGEYLASLFNLPAPFMSALVVVSMGALAWYGIRESVGAAAVITLIEIGGLIGVILWSLAFTDTISLSLTDFVPPVIGPHWSAIATASVLAFFAFVGFEDIVNISEETQNPRRTLPLAICLTLAVTTFLYVAVIGAVLFAVPIEQLAASDAPLALVFSNAPGWVQSSFSVIAIVATINGVLIQIIMASRVFYGMANRQQLPRFLAQLSPRTQTPGVSTALVVLLILALSQFFPIATLAQYTSQVVLCIFLFVNAALVILKTRTDQSGDHFSVPLAIPAIGLITSALLLVVSSI